ncbi:DUF6545 domain-containing protein [Amycolatopsis sp. WAC 04182]|uniref:DUF6545 domain-containing protein n=1 Tax=Amycolatopsis sp. WAC 04182 TaxID=2203198 RepID=UPI000F78CB72|nr:DUF6545 domain-containing protein [Amycolatopsis sp. WAC 04182]
MAAYIAALVTFSECARRLAVDRHLPSALSRDYLTVGLLLASASLVAGAPATMRWSDQHTGVQHVAYLIHCILTMLAMVCMAGFLRTVTMTTVRVRTTVALFAGCAGVLGGLYVLFGTADPQFGVTGRHPASLAFTLIYLGFMITWIVAFIRGAWRISRGADSEVRFGIFLAALGMGVGLVGLVWKALVLLETLVVPDAPIRNSAFTLLAEALGAVLFAAGSGFAAAARRVDESKDQARAEAIKLLWERLRPVWSQSELYTGEDDLDFRRQVVQVFDTCLTLRSYVDPTLEPTIATVITQRRLGARRGARVTAAAKLRIALAAFESGSHVATSGQNADPAPQPTLLAADEQSELGWIAEVARAWTDNAVNDIVQRACASMDPGRCHR